MGARDVNPDARVRVVWTRTWYSPDDEKKAAESLIDVGVDVIAQHQNSAGPQEAAEARGIYSVGYNADMSAAAPHAHLTAAVWNWTDFYRNFIETVHRGGMEQRQLLVRSGQRSCGIAPFGKMVPQDVRDRVNAAQEDIKAGKLTVFAGSGQGPERRGARARGAGGPGSGPLEHGLVCGRRDRYHRISKDRLTGARSFLGEGGRFSQHVPARLPKRIAS